MRRWESVTGNLVLTTVKSVKTDFWSVSPSSAFTLCTIQIVTSETK